MICLTDSDVRYLHSPISKMIKFIMFMIKIVIVRHKRPRCLAVVHSPTHEKTAPPTPKKTFCEKSENNLFENIVYLSRRL